MCHHFRVDDNAQRENNPKEDSNSESTPPSSDKKKTGMVVFGLNLKDPQDLITIGLTAIIAFNTFDIAKTVIEKLSG